jgi:hypothetical protein
MILTFGPGEHVATMRKRIRLNVMF